MNDNELIKKLNKDYLEILTSDEYKLGVFISVFLNSIKKGHFRDAFSLISSKLVSIRNRKISTERHIIPVKFCKRGGRVAVYTAIFGGYDQIYNPMSLDERCDYYIFTDSKIDENCMWKCMDTSILPKGMSNIELNRYIKMHPFELFPKYEYAIYFDGSIEIVGQVSEMIDFINDKTGMAVHNMRNRDCIYDEEITNKNLKKGNYKLTHKQIEKIRNKGFPNHFGMYECGVIAFINTAQTQKILSEWWEEFKVGGGRDQISLPYILWKNGMRFEDMGFLGDDLHINPLFRLHDHK